MIVMRPRRRSRRPPVVLALIVGLPGAARAAGATSGLEDYAPAVPRAAKFLTETLETEHLAIHFRPDSRAAATVDRLAAAAERDYARITAALEMSIQDRIHLFVYDDVEELQAITRNRGAGGLSAGRESHVPHDNDQTRFHEMAHVVSALVPSAGTEARSLFFAEGLANALLEFVDGVHVHAVAAFERGRGALPALAEMTGAPDFYEWIRAHPNLGHYDVAGSYLRFLLDSHGAEAVKRYYAGAPAVEAFGSDEAALETKWHERLDRFPLRPETATLLRNRRGETVAFPTWAGDPSSRLPAEVLGESTEWTPLAESLPSDAPQGWTRTERGIRGATGEGSDWSECTVGADMYADCVVRARVHASSGGVKFKLGSDCEAMVVGNGTFLYGADGPLACEPSETVAVGETAELDLVLRRRGGVASVWVDGLLAVEAAVRGSPAPLTLGVVAGTAEFEDLRVRPLR
jgi:hypothetical protein